MTARQLTWRLAALTAALAALLGAQACDDGAAPDAAAAGDAGESMDAGGEAGEDAGPGCDGGADPFGCEDLTPDPSCPVSWVAGMTGTVQDAAGRPVEGAFTQACLRVHPDDRLVCLVPPMTDADGAFAIVVPAELRCLNRVVMRVVAPRELLAATYCPVEFPADVAPVHAIEAPYVLHPVTPQAVPPRGDPSTEREVALADGVTLTLAPDALALSGDYEELAGGRVEPAATACFAEGMRFDGAYVFTPESLIDGGAALRLPNDDGLAPGTQVELFLVGGLETFLLDGTFVEEAELAPVGTATVTADGAALRSDPGSRLPYLSWLAWRAR